MFAKDKQKHFLAGLLISLLFGTAGSPLTGFIVATITGVVKESYWDCYLKRGTPELLDAIATTIGGALGAFWLVFFW